MRYWSAIIPFKGNVEAKSRLRGLYGIDGPDWADAFLLDTLAAVIEESRIAEIVLVTASKKYPQHPKIRSVTDPERGLNAAIQVGAETAKHSPLVVPGDLVTLNSQDFSTFLTSISECARGFTPDIQNIGTTILFADNAANLKPEYGVNSAAAHRASGACECFAADSLRIDIDNNVSLIDHRNVLGKHTTRLLSMAQHFPGQNPTL